MKKLVEVITKALVDEPDGVVVTEKQELSADRTLSWITKK